MRLWRSAAEIDVNMDKIENRERLFELYGLSLFCDSGFLSEEFRPDDRWGEYIKLSKQGEAYLERFHAIANKFDHAQELFMMFQLFFHYDLLIDHTKTDTEQVISLIKEMNHEGHIKWPYIFGNLLYHKFNDTYVGNRTQYLDSKEVAKLLHNTPQGIFQMGNMVSGPLGLLRAEEHRVIPPTLTFTLWHCSDPGCQAKHSVTLQQHDSLYQQKRKDLIRFITDTFGPFSEWDRPLLHIYNDYHWPQGRPYIDLPAVIGDCLVGDERKQLLLRCLRSDKNTMLMAALRQAGKGTGSPVDISSTLTTDELHQLLLLLPDTTLVFFIDELVSKRTIRIPPAELRIMKSYSFKRGRDTTSRLSSLGIKSTGHEPVLELASAIWSTYEALGMLDELAWRLRGHEGLTVRHSVMEYIKGSGPQYAVKNLILPSHAVVQHIAKKYYFNLYNDEAESVTIDRFLWKFGFNVARYEDDYSILRKRIQDFQDCIMQVGSELNEDDKASIRGIGVNLFVSVESFIEDIVAFNIWLLSSDHFLGTHFRYAKDEAHNTVVSSLGKEVLSGSERFAWSTEGANTLGTLMAYLQSYRVWLKEKQAADREAVVRKQVDFPHYANDAVAFFPFKHTALWADVSPVSFTMYIELMDKLWKQLAQADIVAIRNGLDHKREDDAFPETNKMLSGVVRLLQLVEFADAARLIPKIFWGLKAESDCNGNVCMTFTDYRGSTATLWDPSLSFAIPIKGFGKPFLIAPLDLFSQPNSTLFFNVKGKSDYNTYWKNYPRRRYIPSKEQYFSSQESQDDGS